MKLFKILPFFSIHSVLIILISSCSLSDDTKELYKIFSEVDEFATASRNYLTATLHFYR